MFSIVNIAPAASTIGYLSTEYAVCNVSLLLEGTDVVWPNTMEPSYVDTVFSISYVFLRNVSMTLRRCHWEFTFPSSATINSNPILMLVHAPLLLVQATGSASPQEHLPAGPPGDVRHCPSSNLT